MKPNVLIAACLALLILCTCAVAGVQAAESYAEPDAVLGEWDEKPTDSASLEDAIEDIVYGYGECADSSYRPDSTDEDPSDYKFATQLTQSEDYYVTAYYCVYESEMDGTQTVTKTISDASTTPGHIHRT